MAERASVFEGIQIGAEVTPGVAVPANRRLQVISFNPRPEIPGTPFRPSGQLVPSVVILGKERSVGPIDGRWAYEDLTYLFCSCFHSTTPTTPASATNTRLWAWNPSNNSANTLQSYTLEKGNAITGASRMVNALVNSLTMRFTEEETSITGEVVGKQLVDGITITSSPTTIPARPVNPVQIAGFLGNAPTSGTLANSVQSVTTGGATAGTFTLSLKRPQDVTAQVTAAIDFDAAAGDVQTALEGIVGAGNVAVTGSDPWVVTFQGQMAGLNIATMTMGTGSLTGGTPGVTVTTAGALSKLTRLHEFGYTLQNIVALAYTVDPSESSWSYALPRPPDITAQMLIQHDAVSQALKADALNSVNKLLTVIAYGPEIESGFNYLLRLNIPCKIASLGGVDDRNDEQVATWNLQPAFDEVLNYWTTASLYNTRDTL